MLAARAPGAVGLDLHVLVVEVHLDIVFDFWIDKNRGKRSVPAVTRIKRREPHQAMDAGLGLEVAIRIIPPHLNGCALDAGFLGLLQIHDRAFHAVALGPARVQAHQHRRPFGCVRAPCPRVNDQNCVLGVVLFAEHRAKLQFANAPHRVLDLGFDLGQRLCIALFGRHLPQLVQVLQLRVQGLPIRDGVLEDARRLADGFALPSVAPEVRAGHALF